MPAIFNFDVGISVSVLGCKEQKFTTDSISNQEIAGKITGGSQNWRDARGQALEIDRKPKKQEAGSKGKDAPTLWYPGQPANKWLFIILFRPGSLVQNSQSQERRSPLFGRAQVTCLILAVWGWGGGTGRTRICRSVSPWNYTPPSFMAMRGNWGIKKEIVCWWPNPINVYRYWSHLL